MIPRRLSNTEHEKHFEPAGFPIELGRKDVGLALTTAAGASLAAVRMDSAIAVGGSHRDWSALDFDNDNQILIYHLSLPETLK